MEETLSGKLSRTTAPDLAPGTLVGGRFAVERALGSDSLGTVYLGRDQNTGRAVSLRVIATALVSSQTAFEALRDNVRNAASIDHKNVLRIFGMGQVPNGAWFVAGERVDGVTLADLIAQRLQHGDAGMSLRNAATLIDGIAAALAGARGVTHHAALRPSVVWISHGPRVRVGDFGISLTVLTTSGAGALGAVEQGYLAPEIKAGGKGDVRSDVFGLGAILYTTLTGRSPTDAFVTPSSVNTEVSPELDALILRALAADPAARFSTPEALATALAPFVAQAPAAAPDEIDVAAPTESRHPIKDDANARNAGKRVPLEASFRPNAPQPEPVLPFAAPEGSGEVDLSAALARITENDSPKWMVVKDGLDHGPFSGRELVQSIISGDVLAEHGLVNLDSGARTKVGETPDFLDIVGEAHKKLRSKKEAAAFAHAERKERRSGAAMFVGAGVIALVLIAGAATFLLGRQAAQDDGNAQASLDDLYKRGNVKLEVSAGILPEEHARKRAGGQRAAGGAHGGGAMSYEDAMNIPIDIGDVSAAGGDNSQLSRDQVAATVNAHMNSFGGCIDAEVRNGTRGRAGVDIAIAGSGDVMGVSVRAGSATFQQCVAARMRQVHFPRFGAQRMGARVALPLD